MGHLRAYLLRCLGAALLGLDIFVSGLTGGDWWQTLSARLWKHNGLGGPPQGRVKPWIASWLRPWVDDKALRWFGDKDHCERSWAKFQAIKNLR
jgi:hypothetical protein